MARGEDRIPLSPTPRQRECYNALVHVLPPESLRVFTPFTSPPYLFGNSYRF